MGRWEDIERENLTFKLIYDSVYDPENGCSALNYLQFIKYARETKEALDKHQNGNDSHEYRSRHEYSLSRVEKTKALYYECIPYIAKSLFEFFYKSFSSFDPQVIITPPTSKETIQAPILEPFRSRLPVVNLNEYLENVPGGVGIHKYRKKKDKIDVLSDKEKLLVIDDVYASGETLDSVMFNIGNEKLIMVICPLFVEQKKSYLGAMNTEAVMKVIPDRHKHLFRNNK